MDNKPGSDNNNNPQNKLANKYKIEGREKEIRDWVYDRFTAMKNSSERQKAEIIWRKGREQWEAMRKDGGEDNWQSNHYVPLTTAVVETAMSEIIDQSPKPMIIARGSEDIPRAVVMEHAFEYTWEIADSDLEEEDVLHDALICGTGIGQEYYWKDIRKIKTTLKKDSKLEYETEDQADFDDCYLECVKLEDFYIDELARGFSGPYRARDCIRRYIMDIQAFRDFFKGPVWDPLDNAKYVEPGGDTAYYEKYSPPDSIDKSKQVEVLWYWSIAPEDALWIVANDVVVVPGPNPYKHKQLPFSRAVDIKRTHTFYGKGESELLESIQDETNTYRRMMIDRNHLDIDKMFYGPSRINLTDEDTIARPHGFIAADEDIHPIEYGDTPRSVELGLGHLEDDSVISTGINPRAEALPTSGTATEAAIIKESTLKRIRLKVRRFEREFLTRVARLRVANILQFYAQPRLEEIVGKQETVEFQTEMDQLKAKGEIVESNDQIYQKKYRQIPLKGKQFKTDETGQPAIQDSTQPYSFFELKPEYFLPKGSGYNIKIAAGSTLPVSKALLQSRAQEAFDRLLPLAQQFQNTYDPKKLGDVLVLEPLDINPSDVSVDQPMQNEADKRAIMLVQLATQENKMMMEGKPVPPTPYSSASHSAVHVQFTSSPNFQQLKGNDPRIQIFTNHIVGELTAQAQREGGQTQPDGQVAPQGGNSTLPGAEQGGNRNMNSIMPGKIQGGAQAAAQTPGVIGGR